MRSFVVPAIIGCVAVSFGSGTPGQEAVNLATPSAREEGSPAEAPLTLDVMTFNIRTSEGRDGENSWPNRRDLVAETIRRSDPHIVGLQEGLAVQIEFLETELPEYRWVGVDRGLNGGRGLSEATPIFYRYRELVPIESGTFWLSGDPEGPAGRDEPRGSAAPRVSDGADRSNRSSRRRWAGRIVTWARLHHVETREQIWVFNTHFTLRRGARQLEAMERINARIAALPAGSTVVVMGDFNAVAESSETWEAATRDGLRDAWTIAGERLGPALTGNGFGPPTEGREGRIDWILVGGAVEVPRIETVVHSSNGRYPSDHYPVVARLEIGPQEG